jgi:hypothetical protein
MRYVVKNKEKLITKLKLEALLEKNDKHKKKK